MLIAVNTPIHVWNNDIPSIFIFRCGEACVWSLWGVRHTFKSSFSGPVRWSPHNRPSHGLDCPYFSYFLVFSFYPDMKLANTLLYSNSWAILGIFLIPSHVSSSDIASRAAALPSGWKLQAACATDAANKRLLSVNTITAGMTINSCIQGCAAKNYHWAGVEHGTQVRLHMLYCGMVEFWVLSPIVLVWKHHKHYHCNITRELLRSCVRWRQNFDMRRQLRTCLV